MGRMEEGMRGLVAIVLCGLFAGAVLAADHSFDTGMVAFEWLNNEETLRIHALITEPETGPPIDSHTWVITALVNRFEDGLFAWQVHLSEDHRSVVVIPNDFLTATGFTFEQLGIQLMSYQRASELELWIPRGSGNLSLIEPGDEIAVHALWLQQEPLLTVALLSEAAGGTILAEAAGAVGEASEIAEVEPEPVPEIPADRSPLPSRLIYGRGDPIEHAFQLIDDETGLPVTWAGIGGSLLLPQEGGADALVWFSNVPFDPVTATYHYEIDTTDLEPGMYKLLISSAVLDGGEAAATLVITD